MFAAMAEVWSAFPRAELLLIGPPAGQVERLLGAALPPLVVGLSLHALNASDVPLARRAGAGAVLAAVLMLCALMTAAKVVAATAIMVHTAVIFRRADF